MKFAGVVTCFLLMICVGCSQPLAKTVARDGNLSFAEIDYNDADLHNPGRGAEQWHDRNEIPIPYTNQAAKGAGKYYRFSWSQIETGKNQYDWEAFDAEINDAIEHGQLFSFGIMPLNPLVDLSLPYAVKMEGKAAVFPLYVHEAMQAEPVKDWISPQAKTWIPNWNSESYLNALAQLYRAINNHLMTGSYKGVRYKNVIDYIDIRGYGNYGEWHEAYIVDKMNEHPKGTQATAATLKRIIDIHVSEFPDFRLVAMMSVFDANMLNNTMIPPEVGFHALRVKNNAGRVGWRRDNWGALDNYLDRYLAGNRTVYQDMSFAKEITDRWQTAPIVGEPSHANTSYNGCNYGDLENQIQKYHATSFGNGNISDPQNECVIKNVRAAAKRSGYRLVLTGGQIDSVLHANDSLRIRLDWKNKGIAPVYRPWEISYALHDLRTDSAVWQGRSAFILQTLLPAETSVSVNDQFLLPAGLAAGMYNIRVTVKDPTGYLQPLQLAIHGRQTDGSYTLRTLTVKK